jgi:hypothetical protein
VRNAGNSKLEGAGDPRRAGVAIVCWKLIYHSKFIKCTSRPYY